MTTATILTDLYNITYVTAATKTQLFQVLPDEEFEDFTTFPLIIVESGPEELETMANRVGRSNFHPSVHMVVSDDTASNMESYRDTIRNAIMNDTTLRNDSLDVSVDKITPYLSPNMKRQRLKFDLTILFDITFT